MTGLVEHRPVGFEEGKLTLLILDMGRKRRPFRGRTLNGEFERIDARKHGYRRAEQEDIDIADHAAPRIRGTPSPAKSSARGGSAVRIPLRSTAERARGLRASSAAPDLIALPALRQRSGGGATCGRWREAAGPPLSGSKKRLAIRSSSE